MNLTPTTPASEARLDLALWAGLLAGPVAWFVQLVGVYALATWACRGGSMVVLHLASLACVLVGVGGVLLAWRHWMRVRGWPSDWDEGVVARIRLLSMLGMLGGSLFSLVMVAQWTAVALLSPCPV